MTLRERIADWISGGELSLAWESAHHWNKRWDEACGHLDLAEGDVLARGDALRAIIACETQSANATVKRMARIAREALE